LVVVYTCANVDPGVRPSAIPIFILWIRWNFFYLGNQHIILERLILHLANKKDLEGNKFIFAHVACICALQHLILDTGWDFCWVRGYNHQPDWCIGSIIHKFNKIYALFIREVILRVTIKPWPVGGPWWGSFANAWYYRGRIGVKIPAGVLKAWLSPNNFIAGWSVRVCVARKSKS